MGQSFSRTVFTSQTRGPIIVGLDPGTTTGLAIFSLDGVLLKTVSKRNPSRSFVRSFILHAGSPIAIASDMNPLPKSVQRIASSLAVPAIFPERSLDWRDKRRLLDAFLESFVGDRPWANQHEKDALLAGYRAWRHYRQVERLPVRG